MPGYREGFMDAIIVFLEAAERFQDISTLIQFLQTAQDKLEGFRSREIQRELGLNIEEFEQIEDANILSEQVPV